MVGWSGVKPERVIVIGCGVSSEFTPEGPVYQPGFPYVLYVGNRKPHKNLKRLVAALAPYRTKRCGSSSQECPRSTP